MSGKKLLKHPAFQAFAAWVLSLFIRFARLTNLTTMHIDEAAKPYMAGKDNAIYTFWHGRMMVMPTICPPGRKMRVLISLHRDGTLISRAIGHFGQETVSGSTSKGGAEAAAEIVRSLKSGDNISITPDGPRGPAQIATKGAITLARLSGKPIIPVTFSATRTKRLRSWDRFMLALPLGRIIFCVGAPIFVADDADEEALRQQLELAMNRLVEKADGQAL